jgi:aminopeptidase N
MATLVLFVLAAAWTTVHGFPDEPVAYRNTIFMDERLQGREFEHIDAFNNITLYNTNTNPYRLPTTTRPSHYDVKWWITFSNFSNIGSVDIDLYATQQNVNEIVIHAHDLDIKSLELTLNGIIVHQTWSLQPEYHFLRVRPVAGPLLYNSTQRIYYRLSISFEAPLRDDMYGIYRSWYKRPTEVGQPER